MTIKSIIFGVFALMSATLFAADHKVVIQVSSSDTTTQTLALNNIANLQKAYGDDVIVELVAYGPGLSILTKNSSKNARVESMAVNDHISFAACGNTIKGITKKTGKAPVLSAGVGVAKQGGVTRIMELQEQGYSYIRP